MAVRLKLSLYGQLTHRMHYNCLAGKIDFIQKQPLKQPFWGSTNRPLLTLGGPGGKMLTNYNFWGNPETWDWDITLQMSYVAGRSHQN